MSKYLNRIEEAEGRARELEARIADPDIAKQPGQYQKVARGLGALRPMLEAGERYRAVLADLEDSRSMLDDSDAELAELARAETQELEGKLSALESELAVLLTPKDPNDEKNVIVEIRAGAGVTRPRSLPRISFGCTRASQS